MPSKSSSPCASQRTQCLLLHNRFTATQIQGCDAILARMQEMLLGFQADLGGISDEIKHLQVQKLFFWVIHVMAVRQYNDETTVSCLPFLS